MSGAIQHLNQERVDLLGVSFQKRNEANFALGNIASMLSGIPGLRGAWIASSVDENSNLFDLSEQDRTLTYNGAGFYDYQGLIPYINLDGTNDYLERLDEAGLDITGLETYNAVNKRGLSIGGWFYFDDITIIRYLMSKWLTPNDFSYVLAINGTQNPSFAITSGGTAATQVVVSSSISVVINNWYFIAGTFEPSTGMNIYVNGTKDTNAVGIPANIFSGSADFQIGGIDTVATNRLDGRYSFGFLSSMLLSDTIINNLYQQSRSLFGV